MFWWELMVDVYFLADVALNFRTGFMDHDGKLVMNSRKIARQYITGWFTIDLIACLPVHYFLMAQDAASGMTESEGTRSAVSSGMRGSKILRLLRLAKMLRLARLRRILERYEDTSLGDWLVGYKL